MIIYSDKQLSQKLERAEARANADFVETRARLMPETGATWIEVGGTYAMFDGPESPCTQTFGLGMFDEPTGIEMEKIEGFFAERDAPVFHEVSPMAGPEVVAMLVERDYRPVELTNVMYRPVGQGTPSEGRVNPQIATRVITPAEVDLWAATSAAGWGTEAEGLADFMLQFGRISAQCPGAYPFLAELDDKPIAAGMMFIHNEVAVLAGASTIPEGRRNGAQNALLEARLSFAGERGCTLANMAALPGSQSQKNAQKNGFDIAYTRIKWQKRA